MECLNTILIGMRWYYRKIRWVNATEGPGTRYFGDWERMLPQARLEGKPNNANR
jgi:hypothetical protein